MKKKTKVVAIMLSLCISVSMLAVGVLAASQVSLNVSSSVSFQSTGAYIMATGQVKRGTETSLANLTEEDRPAGDTGTGLSYSYTGYSYTPIGSGSDANAPDGSGSKDLATWNIGSIEFLEREPVVQYEITFKNYGETEVEINITGMPDEITNVEIEGTTLPITVASGQTEVYTLTLTLTKFNVSIDPAVQVNLNTSMVSKNVADTPETGTFTCTFENNMGGAAEGATLDVLINGSKVVSAAWWEDFTEEIEISAGDVITIGVTHNNAVAIGPTGFYLKLYNSNNEMVADAKTVHSKTTNVEYANNFPYIVTGNIKIVVKGYTEGGIGPVG